MGRNKTETPCITFGVFHSNKGEVDKHIISSVKCFDICIPSRTVKQLYGW